ncbi:MAG: hypothetical protein Unbinned4388contig1000_10 [Prokaryotic dsDNA virus sp.]|nr:MAG: hypothetical protein Unbinned4388contig1000_10 [Prokaryotic dsDNA virus sp.]|tara:strand:+ start:28606 stop:29421 length:816 start_codon:yes stop_codon:yes gene_type:complete
MATTAKSRKSSAPTSLYTAPTETRSIYELCQGTSLTIQIIKNNVIAKSGNQRKKMRYSPYAESIWKEKQTDVEAMQIEPIVIEGELVVPANDTLKTEFLDKHPDNEANGGNIFRKRNLGVIADKGIEKTEFITKVQMRIITSATDPNLQEDLRAVGRAMGFTASSNNPDLKYLKQDLFDFIEANPYQHSLKVHSKFDDPVSKTISDIKLAVLMGELVYNSSSNVVKWAGHKDVITVIASGKDWEKELAAFLLSPEGFDYKKELDSIIASRK